MHKRIFTADEIVALHNDMPYVWLLLEVLRYDQNDKASLMRLISYSKEKDELHNLLMEDEEWDWDKKYIFVYTDPDTCDININ